MTSPNFRPEDVKVGSVILFTDNLYRTVTEIQSNPDVAYFDVADRFGLWLDSDFPKTVINGQMGDVSAVSINAPTDTRLTAIEERLTKLEGSFDDELQDNRTMKQVIEGMGGKCPDGEFTVNLVSSGEKTDPMDLGHKQSPKVCPVSGMFLEEPDDGGNFYYVEPWGEARKVPSMYLVDDWMSKAMHEVGNCFATREDAERYAKHLKAMAKLRRLGKVEMDYVTSPIIKYELGQFKMTFELTAYNQLTPEEQNALLWPNEEK